MVSYHRQGHNIALVSYEERMFLLLITNGRICTLQRLSATNPTPAHAADTSSAVTATIS